MFNFDNFDPGSFKPQTPFEGWIYAKIHNVEKTLSNHLKHHTAMEITGLTAFLALMGSLIYFIIKNILLFLSTKN